MKANIQSRRPRRRRQGRRNGTRNGGAAMRTTANSNQLSQILEPLFAIFPVRTTKKLRYASGHFGLSSTSGVVASHVFAMNGLFDPDVTGTGHQPMGFDQMIAFYEHYLVTDCHVEARFSSASGAAGTVSLRMDAGATPITDIERIMEFGGCVTTSIETIGGFGASKTLTFAADLVKFQGMNRSAYTADASMRGDAASNPAELTYLHVQLWNPAGVTVTSNVYVILEFTVTFVEPRTAALS